AQAPSGQGARRRAGPRRKAAGKPVDLQPPGRGADPQEGLGRRARELRARALRPGYMPAVNNLARLDLRENDRVAAKKRYQDFLERDPNNEPALIGLAAVLRTTGADAGAIEKLLRQAAAGNPASVSAHSALINFYMRSRNFTAALGAAQAAQAALPGEPRMVQAVGMT